MKKSYLLMILGLMCMIATGCTKDSVSLHRIIISESGFNDPDTKMHLTLANDGATGSISKLCYDAGDVVLVNGHEFTLAQEGGRWVANAADGNDVEADNFFCIYKNTGIGVSGSGPNYSFNYTSNFTGQVANANATGVILAGSTADSLLTLNPGCCILRFPANETMDYVYVGFDANKVPKQGNIAIANNGAVTVSGSSFLGGVTGENAGEYLQMHSDGGVATYYVAVPVTGAGVQTTLYFKWKYSASEDIYKFKTSNTVSLQPGKVYTVGKTRVSPFNADGSSAAWFWTVSGRSSVRFSPGNLQYNESGQDWRFAPAQYTSVGYDNRNIMHGYEGYLDLFGYGCTGWDNSGTKYWENACLDVDNYCTGNLNGTNNDWGVYLRNQIYYNGRATTAAWRTLTNAEWKSILSRSGKSGLATVGTKHGLVLIPDGIQPIGESNRNWSVPDGLSFTPGTASGYNTNVYTVDEWALMETAGAIFLPVTGYRTDRSDQNDYSVVNGYNDEGHYWTATGSTSTDALEATFGEDGGDGYIAPNSSESTIEISRKYGCAVRLVCNR